jgi:Bacterial Ig-like domain (group 2)
MQRLMVVLPILIPLFTSCPVVSTPIISSVTVSGMSAALKIGGTVQLTPQAKDQNGAVISGQTLTWVSSNPNVASVDAAGVVTAKRIGDATISATTAGIKGEALLKTYSLEAVCGTYNVSGQDALGTTFAYQLRGPNGLPAVAGTKISITGPAGWRTGKPPAMLTYYDAGAWGINWWGLYTSAPVSGTYQNSVTLGGETLTASCAIDVTKKIALTSSFAFSKVSTAGASVTWTKPAGAFNFAAAIQNEATGQTLAELRPTGDTAAFSGLTLDQKTTYYIEVFLANVDLSQDNPVFPAQLDLSITYEKLVF